MSDQEQASQSAVAIKLQTAKQKKETGDQAFKNGDVKAALFSYHETLMYLLGLDKNALQSLGVGPSTTPQKDKDGKDKEKTEVDDMIEKVYANMSACHMKNGNWQRVLDTAEKALAKNEENWKVQFRKAKALGEQGYCDKGIKILEDIKKKNPTDAAIYDSEISRLRAIDNEKDKANKAKLKGFLSREKKTSKTVDAEEEKLVPIEKPASATIEEVS
ncbi:hypothetical protein H0H93_000999 [Arthromyces matolae]|nr:hypothetical protein H0H93_000999 [Arthromyces matolae]